MPATSWLRSLRTLQRCSCNVPTIPCHIRHLGPSDGISEGVPATQAICAENMQLVLYSYIQERVVDRMHHLYTAA